MITLPRLIHLLSVGFYVAGKAQVHDLGQFMFTVPTLRHLL